MVRASTATMIRALVVRDGLEPEDVVPLGSQLPPWLPPMRSGYGSTETRTICRRVRWRI